MLRQLQVLAAALRLRIFTVAELARASNVAEATVHTVLQRSPVDWFTKIRTTTGSRGNQPHRIELSAAGAAGIRERLGKLPNSEPLVEPAPPAESIGVPMGILAARASLEKFTASASPVSEERLRQEALRSLDWAEAELDDGDFVADAAALREQVADLRRQLVAPVKRQSKDAGRYAVWRRYIADNLRAVAAHFDRSYRASKAALIRPRVFYSYFGADARARELASFAAGALATEMRRLGHEWTEPSEAHELLTIGQPGIGKKTFDEPLRLLLCISTPSASQELRAILKQARLLIDSRCFTPESWILDCGHNREVERVTRQLSLNYEPNAQQLNHLARWVNTIFANAARSPLAPGALPFNGPDSKHPVVNKSALISHGPPATRVVIRGLTTNTFDNWTAKHTKGTTIEATIREVEADGATIDLGGGVQAYLEASKLSPEPEADARALLKVHQKVHALYADSSRKRRTITLLVEALIDVHNSVRPAESERVDSYAARGSTTKKMRARSEA